MKLFRKEYKFKNDKCNIKLFCITDFHFTKYTSNNKLDLLLKSINDEKSDYIIFTGDLIDNTKRINDEVLNNLYLFFKKICINNKVIFIKGNHDTKDEFKEHYDLDIFFNKLSSIENFYYLKDSIISIDNINFIGIELYNDHYYINKEEDDSLLIKKINELTNNVDNDKLNILLFHSPINLFKEKTLKKIKNIDKIDFILSGHMHNGIIPHYLDYGNGDRGLLSPRGKLFPKHSRNVIKYNNTNLITLYPLSFYYKIEKYKLNGIFRGGFTIIYIEK